jgi:hypothetical protein
MQGWWADGEGQQEKRPIHLPNPGMNFYSANSLVGLTADRIKTKTVKLVFVASPLSTQH